MSVEAQSAALALPFAVANPLGTTGVMRFAVTAAVSVAIPASMTGKFLRITAKGTAIQVALNYGTAGQTLVLDQLSSPGTGHAAAGATIPDGGFLDGIAGPDAQAGYPPIGGAPSSVYINAIPVSGTGFIEVWCSEQVRV